jgi:hypothetical protein
MKKVPAATTIQGPVSKIPVSFISRIISYISKMVLGNRRVNVAGDSTGIGTMKYERWLTLKTTGKRRGFIKLHGIISTDPGYPIFLSAKVTGGTRHDSPELMPLLKARNRGIKLGNVVLDSGYLSRKNVDLIKMEGGIPIIKGKKNVKSRSKGSPEWKHMIIFQRKRNKEFKELYSRRSVIEGVFGAFKRRFTEVVKSKIMHNREIEVLSKVVVWNTISWAYNCPE